VSFITINLVSPQPHFPLIRADSYHVVGDVLFDFRSALHFSIFRMARM
jgi:hypothetical protein